MKKRVPLPHAFHLARTPVAVLGAGYVGLPLALALISAGYQVVAFDVDPHRIRSLAAGQAGVETVSNEELVRALETERFHPSSDEDNLDSCRAFFVCVPTPLDQAGTPDPSAVTMAVRTVARHAHKDVLVVLESTSYPGTTREIALPPLAERLGTVGEDFFLACVPERIDPGSVGHDVTNIPRVVGGLTPKCTEITAELYRRIGPQCVSASSPEVAEMTKLLENAFRNVNIALVNELMMYCDRIRVPIDEVIASASTKPFGFMPFSPGIGIGGECIPVDPRYLTWSSRRHGKPLSFLERALDLNDAMPSYAVSRVVEALNTLGVAPRKAQVLVLGVAYKPDVADLRNSPALTVVADLLRLGANVKIVDSLVGSVNIEGIELECNSLSEAVLASADLTVLLVRHRGIDYTSVARKARQFLDLTHSLSARAFIVHEVGATPH